jgi:hypothetical protein
MAKDASKGGGRPPATGRPAEVLRQLVERDPRSRSPRRISLDAGLSADAVRLALAGHAVPRAKTLAALAKSLGVDVRVLTGDLRIPDPGAPAVTPPAAKAVRARPVPSEPPTVGTLGTPEQRRALRAAVRAAIRDAVAGGMSSRAALADAVLAAQLSAVSLGLDDLEAAEVLGSIGMPE